MIILMTVGNMAIFGCERSLSCHGLVRVLIRQQFDGWHLQYLLGDVLLPHNNDLDPLKMLFEEFKNTNRIALIDSDETLNCCQLKYVISKCSFMVVARTHASIAAYSTCVPTLVLGYSVKSRGIATDIFGTSDNYVLPVDKISDAADVKKAFMWLTAHEADIKAHYKNVMPDYIQKAYLAAGYLKELG